MGDLSAYLEHSNRETKDIKEPNKSTQTWEFESQFIHSYLPTTIQMRHKMAPKDLPSIVKTVWIWTLWGKLSVAALVVLAMVTGKGCLDSYFTNIF